jgi:hypothetical protein
MYFMEHIGIGFLLMALGLLLLQEHQRRQPRHFVLGFVAVTLMAQGFLSSTVFFLAYWHVFWHWP